MAAKTTPSIPLKYIGNFGLPMLGLGTYGIGGLDNRDLLNDDESQIKKLQEAIKLGFSHLDTAEGYADGYSEILVGKAIKNFDRQQLFLTTKVRRRHLKYDDLIEAAQASLKRLDTPWIDLYLIHAPNPQIPLQETMRAMDTLKENGLIKNIGVSNFTTNLLEEALTYTKYGLANNQIHHNLSARDYEINGTLDFCQKNGILVTAYRAIGFGQYDQKGLEILRKLGEKYSRTPSQIALNWLCQKPNLVALVKSTNPEHLKENITALSFKMGDEDLKYLDTEFPKGKTINLPYYD